MISNNHVLHSEEVKIYLLLFDYYIYSIVLAAIAIVLSLLSFISTLKLSRATFEKKYVA